MVEMNAILDNVALIVWEIAELFEGRNESKFILGMDFGFIQRQNV
jgi:hypothetical protein